MTKILVIGAHGRVSRLALPLLSEASHTVVGVIRNADHSDHVRAAQAEPLVVDITTLDGSSMDALVKGFDVVVWSAGAGGGSPERTRAVDHDAALTLLAAVQRSGARLVMVSYFGSRRDHGVPEDNGFFAYAEAKSLVDEAIRASGADWVILAPSTLTDGVEGGITVDEPVGSIAPGTIPRATVARLIAKVVARPQLREVTLRVNEGPDNIADALSALARA